MELQAISRQIPWIWLGSTIATLVSVYLGWYLNDLSKRRKTTQFSAGPPLTTLLLMRRRMTVAKKMNQVLSGKIEFPTNAEPAINQIMGLFCPELDVSDEEYNHAVWWVAGIDPLLAMWLKIDRSRGGPGINVLTALASAKEAPAGLLDALSEVTEPEKLDESILALARLHGRKTVRKIEVHMKEEDETISESLPKVDQLLESIRTMIPKSSSP